MDLWWPRRGVFPYSFAPAATGPGRILFEPRLGGRYYEIFADGSEYTIGRISRWAPPTQLAYSWQAPDWPGATTIEIRCLAAGEGARLLYAQDGFAAAGLAALAAYYQIGCEQTLAAYAAQCRARHALQRLDGQSSRPPTRSMI